MKDFKDFTIEDFEDMGSLPKWEHDARRVPFVPFVKPANGAKRTPYVNHPVSNLAEVL